MKRTIRLSESELRHMISESVRSALNELHSLTADSALAKAKEQYQQLVSSGQENSPKAQKLLRQIEAFKKYNDFDIDSVEDLDKKNEYGRSASDYVNDVTQASGVKVDPKSWFNADQIYRDNGKKFDYQNMNQQQMNMVQDVNNMPYQKQNYSNIKSPQSFGYEYQKPKKGFMGIGRQKGGWQYKPTK